MKMQSKIIAYALMSSSILLALIGVLHRYSYWWDELYSVAGASLSVGEMMRVLVLPDVHPPLYQITLHGWVNVFGKNEQMVRLLSFMFSLFALWAIWKWSKKNLSDMARYSVIIFFSTCYLFPFYAQEARPYALLLMLATFSTVFYLNGDLHSVGKKSLLYYGMLILLSLAHYFGFIFSGLILLFTIYETRGKYGQSIKAIVAGMLCLVWPLLHFRYGDIGQKTGENFWIKSEGLQSTLHALSLALTPQVSYVATWLPVDIREYFAAFVIFTLLLILVVLAKYSFSEELEAAGKKNKYWSKLAALVGSFIVVVILIDYHSPISTGRNFIVLLPAVSILVGLAVDGARRKGFVYAFPLMVLAGMANISYAAYSVVKKASPVQNHLLATEFIENSMKPQDNIYYLARTGDLHEIQKKMAEFYFSPAVNIRPVLFEDILNVQKPFYVLMQHQNYDVADLLRRLSSKGVEADFRSFQKDRTVVVLFSK